MGKRELIILRNELQKHIIEIMAEVLGCNKEDAARVFIANYGKEFYDWFREEYGKEGSL